MTRPVICIDGPSGSGKGTLARRLAQKLEWLYLDTGAIYRALALRVLDAGAAEDAAAGLAMNLQLRCATESNAVWLNEVDVTAALRTEDTGALASQLAARPDVRAALLDWQRQYGGAEPLVADGRDLGTVVFPAAFGKIFLEASAAERARRRCKELQEMGKDANFDRIYQDISSRDARDRDRVTAPLRPAADALVLDSTALSVDEVFAAAWAHIVSKRLR